MRTFHNHHHCFAAIALVLLLGAGRAAADPRASAPDAAPPADTIEERERQLMEAGYQLRRRGEDAEALAQYEQAYALRRDTKALAQMALAHLALGNWATAHRLLTQALRDRSHPWIEQNRVQLSQELERVDAGVSRLTLTVEPATARLRVDGADYESPAVVVLEPGRTLVEAIAPGYVPLRRELELSAGKEHHEALMLAPEPVLGAAPSSPAGSLPPIAPAAHRTTESEPSARRPVWLGVAGGGALVALGAVVPWSMAEREVSALNRDCETSACDFEARRQRIEDLDLATNVLLVSGISVAALSTVLHLVLSSRGGARSRRRAAPRAGAPATFPLIMPGGGGLGHRVAF